MASIGAKIVGNNDKNYAMLKSVAPDFSTPCMNRTECVFFVVEELNRVWVTGIAVIWMLEGWRYLAAVLELCDRQMVGWVMAGHMRTSRVLDAVEMTVGASARWRTLLKDGD